MTISKVFKYNNLRVRSRRKLMYFSLQSYLGSEREHAHSGEDGDDGYLLKSEVPKFKKKS